MVVVVVVVMVVVVVVVVVVRGTYSSNSEPGARAAATS